MATFRKRNNGWRAEVARSGVRLSKTFPTKAAAEAWALAKEAEILKGIRSADSNFTLKDALLRYRDNISPTKRGVRWEQVRIDAFIRNLPFIREKLTSITPEHLAAYRDERLKVVKGSTVNRDFSLLSSVFKIAIKEWRWCESNPVNDITMPANPKPRDRLIADFEIDAILKALDYERWAKPIKLKHELALCFLLAIETAMRRGEILSLEWQHVHLKQCYVHLPLTKNGFARDVPLSSVAVNILLLLQEKNGNQAHVFALKNASADTMFRKARDKAEINNLVFHDSRHEATTRLARKLSVLELARVTGHKDPRMLMVYYNETAAEIAKKLD